MGGRKRGQVIIMFVLALFVLVGFVALGIDVGYMYSVRNDLQRSADSGALAGAFIFHNGGWMAGEDAPGTLRADAMDRATEFAKMDPVGGAYLVNTDVSFKFPYDDDPLKVNQIEVTVQKNVNLFFAGAIGAPTVTLSATATAEAIPVDQNVECLTPLAFPYPYEDDGDRDYDGEPFILPEDIPQGWYVTFQVANTEPVPPPPAPNSDIRNYVKNGIGGGGPAGEGGQGGAGEIFPLLLCGVFTSRIADPCGDPCPISLGITVIPKDDPTYIPTIDEIQNKLICPTCPIGGNGDPSGFWPGTNLPDSGDPRYSGKDNWLFSPRVMRVMLYDPQIAKATGAITVGGFAGFWIESVSTSPSWPNNADVTGYLVPDSAVGGPSASPPIAPSLKTTRLIQ